ncbi:MAG: hypothetical protein RLZ98_1645 [Pseudomonadota bacterium]|jgi:light-regulated signal transduction histidine kinase (bacteriophytochrome)
MAATAEIGRDAEDFGEPKAAVVEGRSKARSRQAGEFSGVLHLLSHDIRTPLNALIGFSEMMQREILGPLGNQRYQEYARHIRESSDLLLQAAEQALAVSAMLSRRGTRRCAMALDEALGKAAATAGPLSAPFAIEGQARAMADPDTLQMLLEFLLRSAGAYADPDREMTALAREMGSRAELRLTFAQRAVAHVTRLEDDRTMAFAALLVESEGGRLSIARAGSGLCSVTVELESSAQCDLFQSRE